MSSVTRIFLALLLFASRLLLAQNPVPFIQQPLQPPAVAPGVTGFTLDVLGSGFVPGAVVNWNGTPLATTFVSSTQVSAAVPDTNIASAGSPKITAHNPGSPRSNESWFTVSAPDSALFRLRETGTDARAQKMLTGDFNRDGKIDVALTDQAGNVEVLISKGDGTFRKPVDYLLGLYYNTGIVAGDFNNDGILDLASTYGVSSPMLAVLLGNGDGTFQPHQDFPVSLFPEDLVAADFNKDGKLDIIVLALGSERGNGRFSLFLGNGDGTFAPHRDFPADQYGYSVAVGDFNRDGNLDLAEVGGTSPGINIFMGHGDGTFQSPVLYSTGQPSSWVLVADFNGDGFADLAEVAADTNLNGAKVLLNQGDGTFGAPVLYSTPSLSDPVSVAVGDVNADGKVDLIIGDDYGALSDGGISLLLGNGDGTFQPHRESNVAGIAPYAIAVADFNKNGKPDVAVDFQEDVKLVVLVAK